ncbi:hypothetical protein [Crocosphaera chwakensis]|uniref:Uncharacterized protein n=1 Tax=Crocosphaera chwakensis CCY0110 TaxID=391612 RepID=A3IQ55_9CHRO|nr:hypothetical protein [Crocosphaera chwakensis]EAZ91395.1 hypothetical protein CY0110_05477 [Crocosphaera chwakensis CCY0110]
MNNLSSEQNKTMDAIFNDYQEEISLCLTEIKKVITLLEAPIIISGNQQQLSEKLALANKIITQITHRLETLEQHSQLLKKQPYLTELKNYGEIQKLLAYQLEKIKQKTEQWQYSA